jgi:acyl carrier protein phosphodiesterase
MNYLAHAFLSFGDTDILTGNMIADHVKGQKPLEQLPKGIANGIHLHRKIDAFSDTHPSVLRAKVWFRESYHLYSGPILDTLWDHFLANDPAAFPGEADLKAFTQDVYARLEQTAEWHPEPFQRYFPHMKEYDWLYNYRNLKGARRSLGGLERRALHMPSAEEAYEIFIGRYYQLGQCYYELIDDLRAYVKNETIALRA